jgi:hypothetical protein
MRIVVQAMKGNGGVLFVVWGSGSLVSFFGPSGLALPDFEK